MKKKIEKLITGIENFMKMLEFPIYAGGDMVKIPSRFGMTKHFNAKVITSGMGKAGLAAQYLADGLCSIGVPAVYLHPGDAQHGNLGVIQKRDFIVLFSNSGKTREITELRDLIKSMYPNSNDPKVLLISGCEKPIFPVDYFISFGMQDELHKIPVPTTSVLTMMMISMLLITETMDYIRLTEDEYYHYHHGGYIGSFKKNKL